MTQGLIHMRVSHSWIVGDIFAAHALDQFTAEVWQHCAYPCVCVCVSHFFMCMYLHVLRLVGDTESVRMSHY